MEVIVKIRKISRATASVRAKQPVGAEARSKSRSIAKSVRHLSPWTAQSLESSAYLSSPSSDRFRAPLKRLIFCRRSGGAGRRRRLAMEGFKCAVIRAKEIRLEPYLSRTDPAKFHSPQCPYIPRYRVTNDDTPRLSGEEKFERK